MKKWIAVLSVVFAMLAGGWWFASKQLKQRGYQGTGQFLAQVFRNYPKGLDAEPARLRITVDPKDHEQLTAVVEAARERGVIMPEGNRYVPAVLESDGAISKAKLRIKGKLTDHVKGRKWSFRILGRKGGGFKGMQRFSLQHPGTRNYLYEWLYHRIMEREGVIALRYGLVDVTLNDEELGLYAYEEHFGNELLHHNGRVDGPIIRFDPSLYWIQRLNEMEGKRAYESYAQYQAAAVDAYGSGALRKDPEAKRTFEEAVTLMEGCRRGELNASEVFDADLIGKRHAIIDLIGGHHSMDWSDVKFYYDPVRKLFEPVAYESFSVRPLKILAGSHRYVGKPRSARELHDVLFNDEQVLRAYVRHLERVADPQYLDSIFEDLQVPIDSMSSILYQEFPYKELDLSLYRKNAATIGRMLDLPAGAHAYLQAQREDSLELAFIPTSDLPVEIHGLQIGEEEVPIEPSLILPARVRGWPGRPVSLVIARPANWKEIKELRYQWSVLGASAKKVSYVSPFAFGWQPATASKLADPQPATELDFVALDSASGTLVIAPGVHTIQQDVVFPPDLEVVASHPLILNLNNGARMHILGKCDFTGSPDGPIVIQGDSTGGSLLLYAERGLSRFRHVQFKGLGSVEGPDGLTLYRSRVEMDECLFLPAPNTHGCYAALSEVTWRNCAWVEGEDQLRSHLSTLTLNNCNMIDASDDAISMNGGIANMMYVTGKNIAGIGLKVALQAEVQAEQLVFDRVDKAVEVSTGSFVQIDGLHITDAATGLEVDREEVVHGPVQVKINDYKHDRVEEPQRIEAGSKVTINGKQVITRSQGT